MLDERSSLGVVVTVLGLTLLLKSAPHLEAGPASLQKWSPEGVAPLAALAWMRANCGTDIDPREGTPRLEVEDFLRSVGELDLRSAREGEAAACDRARRFAGPVTLNPHGTHFKLTNATSAKVRLREYPQLASYAAPKPGR